MRIILLTINLIHILFKGLCSAHSHIDFILISFSLYWLFSTIGVEICFHNFNHIRERLIRKLFLYLLWKDKITAPRSQRTKRHVKITSSQNRSSQAIAQWILHVKNIEAHVFFAKLFMEIFQPSKLLRMTKPLLSWTFFLFLKGIVWYQYYFIISVITKISDHYVLFLWKHEKNQFVQLPSLMSNVFQVVPKYHAEKLHQLPKEYMVEVGSMMVDVAKAVNVENYNVVQNNGICISATWNRTQMILEESEWAC